MSGKVTKLTPQELAESAGGSNGSSIQTKPRFTAYDLSEFLGLEIKPRGHLLFPWLPEQGLCALHAFRGVGKTYVALGVGFAVATGGEFLGWQAPSAKRVLYIDGEMPAVAMQERLAKIVRSSNVSSADSFQILTPDLQDHGAPNIASIEDQMKLEPILEGVDLIIIDNISTLVRTPHSENDDKSWTAIQTWLLRQRSQGRSVLLIHHEGKGGKQRGTSKREDILDTVIQLRQPQDYEPSEGARFEVSFKKSRGFYGDEAKPFQARLDPNTGEWILTDLETATFDQVVALAKCDDMTQADIARELEINRSTVSRHHKRAKSEGLI